MTDSNLVPQGENTVPEGAFGIGSKTTDDFTETGKLVKKLDETKLGGLNKNLQKSNARVVDFFDNKFLGNQRTFEEILEERSKIINEATVKNEAISEELKKTPASQIVRGSITGPLKAINETVEFFDDIGDYLQGNPYDNNDLIDYSYFEKEGDGAFYQIPQAVTQFLLPMGLASKGLQTLGKGNAILQNPWTRNFIAGWITDFVVEDPYEENLFNMIDSFEGHKGIPILETAIDIFKLPASAFSAKDDISPIEARLRKAFGGSLLGETLTGLSIGFKGLKNSPQTVKRILETLENKKKVLFKDNGIDAAGNELLDPIEQFKQQLKNDRDTLPPRSEDGEFIDPEGFYGIETDEQFDDFFKPVERPPVKPYKTNLEAKRGLSRGADNLKKRLRLEVNLKNADPNEVEAIETFIDTIGDRMFDQNSLSITTKLSQGGQYSFGNNLIKVRRQIVEGFEQGAGGGFGHVMIHELSHGLSRFLPKEDLARYTKEFKSAQNKYLKQFEKEKAAFVRNNTPESLRQKIGPSPISFKLPKITETNYLKKARDYFDKSKFKNENYRFQDIDEYFAENITDEFLDFYRGENRIAGSPLDFAPQGTFKRITQELALFVEDLFVSLKARLGGSQTRKIFNDYVKRKNIKKYRNRPLDTENIEGVTGMAKKKKPKIKSTFNPKLTPETTANGIEGLRKFVLDGGEYFKELDQSGKWPFSRTFGDMLAAANHQTNGEAIEIAEFVIKEFGNFGKKDLAAATINLNRIMNKNADELFQLASKLDEAITTKNIDLIKTVKDNFIEETKLLQGVVYLNKGVKSITGQTLVANKLGGNLSEVAATADDFGKKTTKVTKDTNIDSINRDFIESTKFDEIETTFNKIFELVEQGDTNAAKSLIRLTRYMQAAGGNPEVMKKMTKNFLLKGVEFTNEIYINSILSGPPTHAVNMISTALNTFIKPIERGFGAGKIKFRKNPNLPYNFNNLSNLTFKPEFNTVQFKRSAKELVYMIHSMEDAFKIAKKAFNMNENILDRGAMVQDARRISRNINAEDVKNFGNESVTGLNLRKRFIDLTLADAYIPSLYNGFRKINGFGSRLLITEDEFFKQVNFRAFVKSEAWEKGINKGKQGAELTKYIDEQFKKVIQITESGSTKGLPQSVVDLYKKAKDYAADATFTKDLPNDSFGGGVQKIASHPMGRIIFPFVRTPINIFKAQVRRTPVVNLALKEYREALLSSDEAIASTARGEMYLGGSFWALAGTLAYGQNDDFSPIAMTGGGPNNITASGRALMKQKIESGWQPYSLRFLVYGDDGKPIIGNNGKPKYNYISIKRLDPWSSFFMMAGDLFQIMGQLDESDRTDVAVAASVAFGRNITNKTFLQGMTELGDAISNPFALQSLIERRLANIVNPVSGFGRTVQKGVDSTKFDTTYMPGDDIVMLRQFYNELARTVPGYGSNLFADQNWLTGSFVDYPVGFGPDIFNVINPFTATTSKDNLVLTVINDLKIELQPPQKELLKKKNMPGSGIPLDRQQYAEFVDTVAFHKIGNKRLIETLYLYLNKNTTKALLATANGENINASNMDEQVAIQNQAAANIESEIRSFVSTYKKKH